MTPTSPASNDASCVPIRSTSCGLNTMQPFLSRSPRSCAAVPSPPLPLRAFAPLRETSGLRDLRAETSGRLRALLLLILDRRGEVRLRAHTLQPPAPDEHRRRRDDVEPDALSDVLLHPQA